MNWVDLVMLGIVGLSALAGFLRGFARELLGLAAWALAALVAARYYAAALPLVQNWIEDGLIADVVCFVAVFVIVLVGLSLIANLLSRLVRLSLLGGIDRILGAAFGLVRGAALLVLAYIVLTFVPPDDWPGPVRDAHTLPYLNAGAQYALAQAPERWRPNLPHVGHGSTPASGKESF